MKVKYYVNLAKKKNNIKSDAELARQIGITSSSLCNILNKKTKTPKSWVYMKILDLAQITQDEKEFEMLEYMLVITKKSEYLQSYLSSIKEKNSFYKENCLK